jgi:alginate export protein
LLIQGDTYIENYWSVKRPICNKETKNTLGGISMKLFKVMLVLALVFTVSAVAYAETQSVKVSGDLTMRAFARQNLDLSSGDYGGNPVVSNDATTDWATYLTNTAEIQIDADLTDNVSGVVRLVNQRLWGNDAAEVDGLGAVELNGGTGTLQGIEADSFEVVVDLAYIELKEFLYSPLTLKIGRQDIFFGRGLIVGATLINPTREWAPGEYTTVNSFDAIRATLDYDPWTIDAIFAKIDENNRRSNDDRNLYGVNVGYVFDEYNAEAEGYWFYLQDRRVGPGAPNGLPSDKVSNDVHNIGLRGSFDPIEDWTVALEGTLQFGEYLAFANAGNVAQAERDRLAGLVNAMLEIRTFQDDYAWRPVVTAEYLFQSGQEDVLDENVSTTGDFNQWNPMFQAYDPLKLRTYQNIYYSTQANSTNGCTNQHIITVGATVEPTDSLTVEAKYGHIWLAENVSADNSKTTAGDEIDLELIWDYTEDVQFSLFTGWFFAGDHFGSIEGQDATANDVIGSVKLSF